MTNHQPTGPPESEVPAPMREPAPTTTADKQFDTGECNPRYGLRASGSRCGICRAELRRPDSVELGFCLGCRVVSACVDQDYAQDLRDWYAEEGVR